MSNRYQSIHDITSQHEFGHENDLLYLSNHWKLDQSAITTMTTLTYE